MNKKENNLEYPVIFSPAQEGGFNVSFPDFPGCITFGQTFEEAKQMAQEVLELWLEEMQDKHEDIPPVHDQPIVDRIRVSRPAL